VRRGLGADPVDPRQRQPDARPQPAQRRVEQRNLATVLPGDRTHDRQAQAAAGATAGLATVEAVEHPSALGRRDARAAIVDVDHGRVAVDRRADLHARWRAAVVHGVVDQIAQQAAQRVGMSLPKYVILGMDPDFREQLYHAGRAMDAAGVQWSILSAFRDDYRQRIASGIKASGGNSLHGGSRRTGGYGHGQAVDVAGADGTDMSEVWRWIDAHGAKYGLFRPMPGYDPAHIQSRGEWRKLAASLRQARIKEAQAQRPAVAEAPKDGKENGKASVVAAAAQ